MATNRYGQIYHGDYHHINIRFPSTEARLKFQNEFEAYHQGHDHEGDIPTFKCVSSKDLKLSTGSRSPQDLVKAETDENYRITIDGYSWNEIHEYHNPTGWKDSFWYSVPTCCVPPIIVIDHKFVDAGTLQRHELSAIFGDMPDTDFQSLLDSVQTDGFIDSIVRIHEGQILDGWHRYRAAQELNLIRKLRFQEWNEDEHRDGDPKAFVLARNIERRHLGASQRAQIAVVFNERFGHGGDRSKSSNEPLKTQEELAAQANVSKSSIKRAVQVEKAGLSETVIAGEKAASEVITEVTLETLWEQVNAAIPKWKEKREGVGHASRTMFIHATLKFHSLPHDSETNVDVLKKLLHLLSASTTDILEILVKKQLRGESLWSTDDAAAVEKPLEEKSMETSDDREASKLLKKKNQTLKSMWDARKQAAADYVGEGDTDLNLYLSLPQLEAGFAKNHGFMADAFKSGMERTSFAGTFQGYQERALESGVSLEDLEKEYQAIRTYAYDILIWERQEWIQQLILQKKSVHPVEDPADAEPVSEVAPDADDNQASCETGEDVIEAFFKARTELESFYATTEIAKSGVDYYKVRSAAKNEFGCVGSQLFAEPAESLRDKFKNPQVYTQWRELLGKIRKGLEDNADWVTALLSRETSVTESNAVPEVSDWTQQYQQTLESVQKFKERLKAFGASDDLVDETLFFYHGLEEADLSTSPQETLKQLNEFLQGFTEKPLPEWPEWIRNHVPERELTLVTIGISNKTLDEFEMVEFTDETSDEVWCKLNELPEHLREALFKIAVEKILDSSEDAK